MKYKTHCPTDKKKFPWGIAPGILLFLVFSNTLPAQPLDELIQQAVQANGRVKASELTYQAELAKIDQVSTLPAPELGIGVGVLPVETRLGPQRLRLGATQMLPWPGSLQAKAEQQRLMAEVSVFGIERNRRLLADQVRRAYFSWYELVESRRILARNNSLLEQMERIALSKVESGRGSLADVLSIQLQQRKLAEQISLLNTREAIPLAQLNAALNQPQNSLLTLQDSFQFTELIWQKDSLLRQVLDQDTELGGLSVQRQQSAQAQKVNKLAAKPSFGVGIDYVLTAQRNDADPSGNGRDVLMPRVMIKLPIYGKAFAAKDLEEDLRVQAYAQMEDSREDELAAMIYAAFSRQRAARIQYEATQEQIKLSRQIIDLRTAAYANGTDSFSELLRLYLDLSNYELALLSSIMDSHRVQADLFKLLPL